MEAPALPVTRPSRSSATRSIDNSLGLPPLVIHAFGAHCQKATSSAARKMEEAAN
jgi:hypothetical protein